ncbi:hypothetical protein D6810_02805 [Candidatus Dojkabacteria bacterium]|uniref:Uncharacterized protein n=1 Tax=Candidatus Dojkabacteria bacterium TaxID=2099670 RepID=A0A3M0Z1M2_9BACT|nr:MAG: hypothetical protein D6810_02805 [Candidatus Dojkabacteria bacterium]
MEGKKEVRSTGETRRVRLVYRDEGGQQIEKEIDPEQMTAGEIVVYWLGLARNTAYFEPITLRGRVLPLVGQATGAPTRLITRGEDESGISTHLIMEGCEETPIPEAILRSLERIVMEYCVKFTKLVDNIDRDQARVAGVEGSSYPLIRGLVRHPDSEGNIICPIGLQIDMAFIPREIREIAHLFNQQELEKALKMLIFEIENSLAMYHLTASMGAEVSEIEVDGQRQQVLVYGQFMMRWHKMIELLKEYYQERLGRPVIIVVAGGSTEKTLSMLRYEWFNPNVEPGDDLFAKGQETEVYIKDGDGLSKLKICSPTGFSELWGPRRVLQFLVESILKRRKGETQKDEPQPIIYLRSSLGTSILRRTGDFISTISSFDRNPYLLLKEVLGLDDDSIESMMRDYGITKEDLFRELMGIVITPNMRPGDNDTKGYMEEMGMGIEFRSIFDLFSHEAIAIAALNSLPFQKGNKYKEFSENINDSNDQNKAKTFIEDLILYLRYWVIQRKNTAEIPVDKEVIRRIEGRNFIQYLAAGRNLTPEDCEPFLRRLINSLIEMIINGGEIPKKLTKQDKNKQGGEAATSTIRVEALMGVKAQLLFQSGIQIFSEGSSEELWFKPRGLSFGAYGHIRPEGNPQRPREAARDYWRSVIFNLLNGLEYVAQRALPNFVFNLEGLEGEGHQGQGIYQGIHRLFFVLTQGENGELKYQLAGGFTNLVPAESGSSVPVHGGRKAIYLSVEV